MLLSIPEISADFPIETAKPPCPSLPEAGGMLCRSRRFREISRIYRFYRFIRRGTRRFLRSAIVGIDLDHFPGSCCG
jgi:hypothetical protein